MWRVEYEPSDALLRVQLAEQVDVRQMRALSTAHARALESTAGEPFRLLLDLRGLFPLDNDAADVLGDMKRVAAGVSGYQARAVLVDSPTIAIQQRRDGGGADELITSDATEAKAFLDRSRR